MPCASLLLGGDVVALAAPSLLLAPTMVVPYVATTLLVLAVSGAYRNRLTPTVSTDAAGLAARVALPGVALGALAGADTSFLRAVALAIPAVLAVRAATYALVRAGRCRSGREPTLIVGAGAVAAQLARRLQEHPEYGLEPIGYLDSFADRPLPLARLGDIDDLATVLEERGIRRVIVAFGARREHELVSVLRACERPDVEVYIVPRFFELGLAPRGPETEDLWGLPLVRVKRAALTTKAWRVKRAVDVAVSAAALLVLSPLMALTALAVKLTSRGPVLYRQLRVGQRGRPIEVLKFRTMHINNDGETTWSVTADPRVTAIGRILRPLSIDELPQLVNVLRGEMSLVGPRPERPHFAHQFASEVPRYDDRHRVPAGITGLAQVQGLRGDTCIEERAVFDNQYIEHWSLWLDLVILLRTVGTVLRPPRSVRVEKPAEAPSPIGLDLVAAAAAAEPAFAEPALVNQAG